jgi:hypothetical protein
MSELTNVEQIWVSTSEGAEITGYNADYLQQLARKISRQPEDERAIKVRSRSKRYELWLPDLVNYIKNLGYGPRKPT